MSEIEQIRQTLYNKAQTEYQYFPEEYFTGADISIYFNDIFIDEITGLSYSLQETVKPIFGYASYTWDAIARGTRIIQGEFRIAFKEAQYINVVLKTLAENQSTIAPRSMQLLSNAEVNKFTSGIEDTIEDNLIRDFGDLTEEQVIERQQKDIYKWKIPMSMESQNDTEQVKELQQRLIKLGYGWNKRQYTNWKTNLQQTKTGLISTSIIKKNDVQSNQWITMRRYAEKTTYLGDAKDDKKYRQAIKEDADLITRLKEIPLLRKIIKEKPFTVIPPGTTLYNNDVMNALKYLLEQAKVNDNSKGRWVSLQAKELLEIGLEVNGVYDLATMLAVKAFQLENNIQATGIIGQQTLEAISPMITTKEVKTVVLKSITQSPDRLFENRAAQYESYLWGQPSKENDGDTFFYNKERNGSILRKSGFDIYIVYGPIAENVIRLSKGNEMVTKLNENVTNFNTTSRSIKNVQIMSVSQIVDVSGQPIEESYTFMARDID